VPAPGHEPPVTRGAFDSAAISPNLTKHMFVLGIDPGLSATGYGLIESGHPPVAHLAGVIRTDPGLPMSVRLAELHAGLTQIIEEGKPDVVAVETVFTNRNLQTAIAVGRASGVALLAAAEAGLSVSEYVPTAIKSAITGDGAASKPQIQQMVARLLKLAEPPRPADAADALAIALCHTRSAYLESVR
jgi:crossover junction endodeoxyribonuclease RuvC